MDKTLKIYIALLVLLHSGYCCNRQQSPETH